MGDTVVSRGKMLDGQHQKVDISAHTRIAHKGLLQKKTGRGSLLNRPSCPLDDRIGQGTELNWTSIDLPWSRCRAHHKGNTTWWGELLIHQEAHGPFKLYFRLRILWFRHIYSYGPLAVWIFSKIDCLIMTGLYPISKIHYAPDPFYPPWLPEVAWSPWKELRKYDDIRSLNISYPFGLVPLDYQVGIPLWQHSNTLLPPPSRHHYHHSHPRSAPPSFPIPFTEKWWKVKSEYIICQTRTPSALYREFSESVCRQSVCSSVGVDRNHARSAKTPVCWTR